MRIHFGCWTVALSGGLAMGVLGCNPATGEQPVVAQGRHVHPPVVERRPMQQPRLLASAVDSAPVTGATAIAGASVDARVLIITANGDDAAFPRSDRRWASSGRPRDVLDATNGPTLTAAILADGDHGKYQAIFLDLGDLSVDGVSAFSDDEWMTLASYEARFGVRRVSLYTFPTVAYGLADAGGAAIDPTADADHGPLHRRRRPPRSWARTAPRRS